MGHRGDGAFTSIYHCTSLLTWKYATWLTERIRGGLALGLIFLAAPASPPLGRAATYKGYSKGMFKQVAKCDWLGVAITMGWATCLILFMQWGGVTKKWNDGSVIACIVMTVVLPPVFIGYEYWLGEHAMFKLALLKRRSIS